MADGQLPLALPFKPALGPGDFLPHAGVQLALDVMASETPWPQHRLVLWGGPGVGKTHLLHVWASQTGASVVDGRLLREPFWPEGSISIDDADQVPSEEALLHVLNAAAESGHRLLLTLDPAAGAVPDPAGGPGEPAAGDHGGRVGAAG